ncbi:MAG: hypothetical protein GF331_17395 [Chitinivibrionales bacterium]|nr:hypothetical protein [Chitinivibrionales bacterium]
MLIRDASSVAIILLSLASAPLHTAHAAVGGGRDGFVVWESLQNNRWRIFKANLDGSAKVQISGDESGAHQGPVISTDGRRVAYARVPDDNGSEYPAEGRDLEIWVVNRDGSNRHKVFDNARGAGECRMLRWLGPSHLAIGTVNGTYRVYIPETGMGTIQAGTLTGGRQTTASGLIVHTHNGKVLMSSPTGNKAYHGGAGEGRVYEVSDDHSAVNSMSPGGCQGFVSADDMYAVGAEYQGMDNTVTFTDSDPTKVHPHDKGTYDGSNTDGYWYDYFPTIGNDNTVGAIGKSPGDHGHRSANYEIFVFDLAEQSGLLRPTGEKVNVSNNPTCDRWPDVWVYSGEQSPALNLDKTSLAFLSQYGVTGNPPSQQVHAVNIGGGTLPVLSATDNRDWLAASVSGTGNDQVVTVTVERGTLEPNVYTGTVTVSGTDLTPVTIAVTYEVKGPQIASSMVITPANATIAPSASLDFSAQVLDEQGDPMAGTVIWSVDHGGFIDQTGRFTNNGTVGTVTVTATLEGNAAIAATASVVVTAIPTDGILVWYRADAGVVASGDGKVQRWEDQSGNANHAVQDNSTHQPILLADGYSGKPALRFSGNQFLDFTQARATGFTVVLVFKITTLTNELLQWALSAVYGENQGYHVGSLDQTGFPTFLAFDGTCMAEDVAPVVGEFRHLISVNNALYFNGVAAPLADTIPWDGHRNNVGTLNGMALSRIGGYANGGTHNLNGDIAEVIFYNRTLSASERALVDGYLNDKYGAAPITILSPNGSETLSPGDQIEITWKTGSVTNVNLFYSLDDGENWHAINTGRGVANTDPQWGAYSWTVPEAHSQQCLIRIQEYTNVDVYDISDAHFSIEASSVVAGRRRSAAEAIRVRYSRAGLHVDGHMLAGGAVVQVYNCRGMLLAEAVSARGTAAGMAFPRFGAGSYVLVVKDEKERRIVPITLAPRGAGTPGMGSRSGVR